MPVEIICIAPASGAELKVVDRARVVRGAGIEGDRFFARENAEPAQNVTLVEAEEVERFNAEHGSKLPLVATRRNIVTRDVRLNDLVDREFVIGGVRFRGVELCEPCAVLGRYLASDTGLSRQAVVRHLAGKAGLRAEAISSGTITVGDEVRG